MHARTERQREARHANSSSVLLFINSTLPWFPRIDVIVIINVRLSHFSRTELAPERLFVVQPSTANPSKSTNADNKWQHRQASAGSLPGARTLPRHQKSRAGLSVEAFEWEGRSADRIHKTKTLPELSVGPDNDSLSFKSLLVNTSSHSHSMFF